jgi:sirohydrochlorin ferrochelatase
VDALILFSHGSLLCGAGEALEAHAERLRATGNWSDVAVGYLNYSDPPFEQALNQLVARGARDVVVAPYFLVPGYFVSKALPEVLARAQSAHPAIRFRVGEALGTDDSLVDALLDSALHARGAGEWRDPLHRAASACRPSPECPLYHTPACPKAPGELHNA